MAPIFTNRPFSRLLTLFIGIFLFLAVIGTYGFSAIQRNLLANSGESLALSASDIADKIDRLIRERLEDIDFVAQSLDLHTQDPDNITSILQDLKNTHPSFLSISLADLQGRIVASIHKPHIGRDLAHLPGFQAIKNGQPHHFEVAKFHDGEQGGASLIVTHAVEPNSGTAGGIIVAEVPIADLEQIFLQTQQVIQETRHSQTPMEWQLLTTDGEIILDSHLHEEGKMSLTTLDLPSALLVTSGKSGYIEEIHKRRHVPVITGFAAPNKHHISSNLDWGVLVHMDQSDVLPGIQAKIFRLGMGISLVLLDQLQIWWSRGLLSDHAVVMPN